MKTIPLVRPCFPSKEQIWNYFQHSIDAGVYSNFGPCHELLIKALNTKLGKWCVLTNNGTDALALAIQTTMKRGARVAMPDYTHIGTLNAIVRTGCVPVLFPVDYTTWQMSIERLKKYASEWDAAVVVSPFGYDVNFAKYDEFFASMNRPVVYDLAGAWGMDTPTKNPVAFSFHATKAFSCGEGGVACFSVENELAKRLSNFDTLLDRSVGSIHGTNCKIDELKCAVILAQLENPLIKERIRTRRNLIARYQTIPNQAPPAHKVPSLCVIPGLPAKQILENQDKWGFVAKQYYPLLSYMPNIERSVKIISKSDPYYFSCCMALPSDATKEECDYIMERVWEAMGKR